MIITFPMSGNIHTSLLTRKNFGVRGVKCSGYVNPAKCEPDDTRARNFITISDGSVLGKQFISWSMVGSIIIEIVIETMTIKVPEIY